MADWLMRAGKQEERQPFDLDNNVDDLRWSRAMKRPEIMVGASPFVKSEEKARRSTDLQLTAAGWVVQGKRHLNLHAAPGRMTP
jgi:hypothetical protein